MPPPANFWRMRRRQDKLVLALIAILGASRATNCQPNVNVGCGAAPAAPLPASTTVEPHPMPSHRTHHQSP